MKKFHELLRGDRTVGSTLPNAGRPVNIDSYNVQDERDLEIISSFSRRK